MIPSGAPILTAEAMRAAEDRLFRRVPQEEVMERAGAAVAREGARFAMGRPILVVVGPGNNGGDGYVAARLLAESGHDVCVAALSDPATPVAAAMAERWAGPTTSLYEARPRPFVIDAMFGTGLSRPLDRGPRALLSDLCKSAQFVMAVDLPSGLDTDTGAHLGAPRADCTLALGALKPGHVLEAGGECCGQVLLADLGIAAETEWRIVARPSIAPPGAQDHKYSRGMVAVIEGAMPGAARLAARAALAGGAGYVVLGGMGAVPGEPDALVRRPLADADDVSELLTDDRIGAVVIGPGLGRERRGEQLLKAALASGLPLVLDGDALSLLGRSAGRWLTDRRAPAWITPHSGEFDRMFGEQSGSKIERTLAAAAESNATVIHKGADSVAASPQGAVRVLAGASPWLSTAGTGDVLAGILAAQVAGGRKGVEAAEAALWLHARAAWQAGPAFVADSLIDHLPGAISECL